MSTTLEQAEILLINGLSENHKTANQAIEESEEIKGYKTEKTLTVSSLCENINERVFCERDRNILKRRYIDGYTYEYIGEMFEMSAKQIRRICKKYEMKIYKGLKCPF